MQRQRVLEEIEKGTLKEYKGVSQIVGAMWYMYFFDSYGYN